jgi:hypothetical protein
VPPSETIELRPQHPVTFQSDGADFTQHPDGTEVVSLFGGDDANQISGIQQGDSSAFSAGGSSFSTNLAEWMSTSQRNYLAQRLTEYHRVDLDSRKDWEALTRSGLSLLGIEKLEVTRLPFPGAASMQHPVIAEACVQFNSNAIQEFFPPTGPVKGDPLGDVTDDVEDSAERAAQYMNYYLTVTDTGYYADKDQSLFYLPVAGSLFVKGWLDPRDQMPRARYVKAEDFIAPYFATDLENCSRYCHQYQMTRGEMARAMSLGEFVDLNLPRPPMTAEDEGQRLEDIADRRVRSLHDEDELFDILEYHIDLNLPEGVDELDEGGLELPYIVICDKTSQEILSVRRNWRQTDPLRKKRVWFAHYKFLPGLGFYGWGFLHVIGSLAEAIGGSARALLDSALMATIQGGFRAKDGAKRGGSLTVQPGKWIDVDATSEELAKTFYTPPAKEPSPALVQLFQSMVSDARRFASLTEVLVGQADNKAPVGTTLALIEQSMKLFTAVHKRIFAAAREEFRMLRELIHDFSPNARYPYHLKGQAQQAMKADFGDHVSFVPVADPNIISDVQRISMAQAVLELVEKAPQLYGPEQQIEAHIRFLKALKVPDWEKIAPQLPQPTYMDPVGENMLLMTGKAVRAFPGQRHDLHNLLHDRMDQIAQNTLPPDQYQVVHAAIMAHIREHVALQAYEQVSAGMKQSHQIPLPPTDLYGPNQAMDPHLEMAVSILAAQNLPPLPAPVPGSQASVQGGGPQSGQAPPQVEAQQQVAADQAKTAADIHNKQAETHAKIQRETADFVAEHKQRESEHAQRLRHQDEEHRLRMRHKDEESASTILRKHADGLVANRHKQAAHTQSMLQAVDSHHLDLKHQRAESQESLLAKKAQRRTMAKQASSRPLKKAA